MQSVAEELLYDGRLHSPYFIFIRQLHEYSDFDILTRFQLSGYRRSAIAPSLRCHAILADAGNWTMLADDWFYTLWHMESTHPAIEDIARFHEVFACTEGDCDRSFDYCHYREGRLARKYVVSSPQFTDRIVIEDVGSPLPDEIQLLKDDGYNIGIELAERMGIKTRFANEDLRIYVPLHDAV